MDFFSGDFEYFKNHLWSACDQSFQYELVTSAINTGKSSILLGKAKTIVLKH